MQPNLRLAENSSVAARQLGREATLVLARNLVLHPLAPVTPAAGHNSPPSNQTQVKTAYFQLSAVAGIHMLGIFWLLNVAPSLPTHELKAEQSTISVSLLSPLAATPLPTTVPTIVPTTKPKLKSVAKPIEKLATTPVEKLSPAKTEAVTAKPEAISVEAATPSAMSTDSARLVAPTETAVVPVATKVTEARIDPPRFAAAYLHNPAPEYPHISRRMGEQGRVLLRVLVSSTGIADSVQIESSSGSSKLDEAALKAVEKWNFVPAKRSNQPVSAYVLVPVKFSLNS